MNISIRKNSAVFTPPTIAVGDVETIEIELKNIGQILHKAVLQANGKTYVFDANNKIFINRADVDGVLVAELLDVDDTGKVLQKWSCEQLFILPIINDNEDALITERLFYKRYIANLLQTIEKLEQRVCSLEKNDFNGLVEEVEALKNGKFKILKF